MIAVSPWLVECQKCKTTFKTRAIKPYCCRCNIKTEIVWVRKATKEDLKRKVTTKEVVNV